MSKTIFITGASGYVGSAVTEFAISEGYAVRGLSRLTKSDEKLAALGATPVRGDLHTLDVLSAEAARADIVMHLADSFLDKMDPAVYEEVIRTDGAAVDALSGPLKGTDKPLVVTAGTLVAAPDPHGGETDETSPADPAPFIDRGRSEAYALSLAKSGVRVISIRLAPYVYGRAGSGAYMFLAMAAQSKQAVYIDDGHWRTSTVHVDDAARLYVLAAEKGEAGDVFNATNATDLTARRLAEAMANALDVPAVSITEEDAGKRLGPFLPKFLTAENRASSKKAREKLGWKPAGVSLVEDIEQGSYKEAAKRLMGA